MNNTLVKQGWDFRVEPAPCARPAPLPLAEQVRQAGGVFLETLQVEKDPHGLDQHAPGSKLDNGKQLASVLLDFSRALSKVADIGTFGAQKYTRRGWEAVPNGEERYTDAMIRHLLKHGQGEEFDPDHGIEHLAAVIWNACAALELKLRRKEA